MNETGLPSPFIDIMMLSPAVRTSVMPAWSLGSRTSTTPPHFCPGTVEAKAELGHQVLERGETAKILLPGILGELDQQHRLGVAADEGVHGGAKHVDAAGKRNHGAIDKFHRDRRELDDILGRIHGVMEAGEMAGADGAAAEQRRELELDAGGKPERALGADQDVGEIVLGRVAGERIEIVAADAALHLGKARRDLIGFPRPDGEQVLRQSPQRRARRQFPQAGTDGTEMRRRAVRQHRIDRQQVIAGDAVAQRARAAGIVARHAADGGARGGGDVDRKPQSMGFEVAVELVEHDAGLDHAAPSRNVELNDAVEIFGAVDDEGAIDGLAALGGAAAARQHGHAFLARQRNGALGLRDRARRHHPDRHDLVMGGVGCIAAAREAIEAYVAGDLGFEPAFKPGWGLRRSRRHASILPTRPFADRP